MTKRLTIQGLGLVGGFGCGAEALRRALCPPRPGQPPPPLQAPPVDVSRLERLVERKSLRRIDHFSRLALLGAFLALEDAAALTTPRDRMALILATGYGAAQTTFAFQDSYLDHGDRCASPTHFSTSVHNVAAAGIAITLGLPGPVLTVSQFELSTVSALLTASQWLATGRVDRVLFGNVDECCPVLEYGWERLREPDPTAAIPAGHQLRRPPGEGAAFFLLARDDATAPYGGVTDLHLGRLAAGTPPCPPASRIILNDQRTLWPHHP
ncbi:MAG: beta-ketoacyl synthase N-terminal-like domain-containing protein, partial [bacterium]